MIPAKDEIVLDLKALSGRSSQSVRWLSEYLKPEHPKMIPHFRTRGKIFVRWSEYLQWFENFRVQGNIKEQLNNIVVELERKGQEPYSMRPQNPV